MELVPCCLELSRPPRHLPYFVSRHALLITSILFLFFLCPHCDGLPFFGTRCSIVYDKISSRRCQMGNATGYSDSCITQNKMFKIDVRENPYVLIYIYICLHCSKPDHVQKHSAQTKIDCSNKKDQQPCMDWKPIIHQSSRGQFLYHHHTVLRCNSVHNLVRKHYNIAVL